MSAGLWLGVLLVAALPRTPDPADRVAADVKAGRPLVAHVMVALCDNDHQGIVPVPRTLGNGAEPRSNLYWGARFGVKTFLARAPGWRLRATTPAPRPGVLERVVLTTDLRRDGHASVLYVVADAWEGRRMNEAILAFLEAASGRGAETVHVDGADIDGGGASHVVVFVGHNGLMDFSAPSVAAGAAEPARAAMVLACASAPYFTSLLQRAAARPVLLTHGLMAPEAYTLEAGLRAYFSGAPVADAAAGAYDRYQHCGLAAARRLFRDTGMTP